MDDDEFETTETADTADTADTTTATAETKNTTSLDKPTSKMKRSQSAVVHATTPSFVLKKKKSGRRAPRHSVATFMLPANLLLESTTSIDDVVNAENVIIHAEEEEEEEEEDGTNLNAWSSARKMDALENETSKTTLRASTLTSSVKIKRDNQKRKVINGYTILSHLGEGAFGKVKKVSKENKEWAMKILNRKMLKKKSTKYNDLLGDVRREVELHRYLSNEGHPHIVYLHEGRFIFFCFVVEFLALLLYVHVLTFSLLFSLLC